MPRDRRLSEFGHSIPIIMVSAYDDRVRTKALEQGALIVLGKPFSGETLLAAIRSALESNRAKKKELSGALVK